MSNYQANGEFDLLDFSARRNVEYYSCCSEPYPDITYEIRLRRRPMFYVFNLILPCILINGVGKFLLHFVPFVPVLIRNDKIEGGARNRLWNIRLFHRTMFLSFKKVVFLLDGWEEISSIRSNHEASLKRKDSRTYGFPVLKGIFTGIVGI